MKLILKTWFSCLVTFLPVAVLSAAGTLEIAVVDTEGGKVMVMLTPDGESMLVDAGFPGSNDRDTKRIVAAAEELQIKQFDYILAVMNNGARKGGDPVTFDMLKASPGLLDLWQLHTSVSAKDKNAPADFIANTQEPCEGKAIKVSVQRNGTFTVTNMRNQFSKTYKP
jgi:hypothetical protein